MPTQPISAEWGGQKCSVRCSSCRATCDWPPLRCYLDLKLVVVRLDTGGRAEHSAHNRLDATFEPVRADIRRQGGNPAATSEGWRGLSTLAQEFVWSSVHACLKIPPETVTGETTGEEPIAQTFDYQTKARALWADQCG